MALALNLIALPVMAAPVAGTGAVATFVNGSASGSASTPPAVAVQAEQPCATQTWPYIDSKCMTGAQAKAPVRMVIAPRSHETSDAVIGNANTVPSAAVPAGTSATTPERALFTSRDTVLRQPDALASPPKVSKPREKRSDRKRQRRVVTQSYQVPSELQDRGSRAVLVVRPLRLETFH